VFLGLLRKVAANCTVLGYYAASSGNFLPTFRYNLSVPILRVQESKNPVAPILYLIAISRIAQS